MWGIKQNHKAYMVKGYALKEELGFCIEYLVDFTTTRCRVGMTKKIHQCLKVVGVHELCPLNFGTWPVPLCSKM